MVDAIQYNEKIKLQFPDEWLLIGNPLYDNAILIGGYILYHSKDKKEVCYIGRDKTSNFDRVTLVYNGDIKLSRKNGILRRL